MVLRRWARRLIEPIALVALIVAPFAVYATVRPGSPAAGPPPWPADVVAVAERGGEMSGFFLLHYGGRADDPRVVSFPAETTIQVPDMGRLRAATVYGIGGAGLVAEGLAEALGTEIPYHLAGPGLPRSATPTAPTPEAGARYNLGTHAAEVEAALGQIRSGARPIVPAPGAQRGSGDLVSFVLDLRALRAALAAPTAAAALEAVEAATPKPAPPPPKPAEVSVDVLNGGASSGAATEIARFLRTKKFRIGRIGDLAGPAVEGIVIYYRADAARAALVAEALSEQQGVARPRKLPKGLTTEADVLVVVGRASPAPGASPTASPAR